MFEIPNLEGTTAAIIEIQGRGLIAINPSIEVLYPPQKKRKLYGRRQDCDVYNESQLKGHFFTKIG